MFIQLWALEQGIYIYSYIKNCNRILIVIILQVCKRNLTTILHILIELRGVAILYHRMLPLALVGFWLENSLEILDKKRFVYTFDPRL